MKEAIKYRLNPFEFRASVQTNNDPILMFYATVSIPLNSGRQSRHEHMGAYAIRTESQSL